MVNFKAEHDAWKEKKKQAEACWENLKQKTSTFQGDLLGDIIKHEVIKFPGFSAGLGPALDNLTKATGDLEKKDKKPPELEKIKATIKKEKEIAKKAVLQYSGHLVELDMNRKKVAANNKPPVKTPKNERYFEGLKKHFEDVNSALALAQTALNNLSQALTNIDKKLNEVKV